MFDKLVAGLVTTYLGKYFENVNKDQVKVSLWDGNVQLRQLRLRKDVLRAIDTSVCVKEGTIDELTVVIPWSRLQSECVVVLLKNVRITLQQKTAAGYDPEREREEAYARKQHQLKIFEALIQQEETSGSGEQRPTAQVECVHESVATDETRKNATFAARLKANILNNVKLEVQNVHVEYEGCHNVSVLIDAFKTHACDWRYEPHFTAARERVLYKNVVLEYLRVSIDDRKVSREAHEVSREAHEVSREAMSAGDSAPPEHVMRCARAVARVQYQPVPYRGDLPTVGIDFAIDAVRAEMDRTQFAALRATWRELCDGESFDALRRLRAPCGAARPTSDPRVWWRFATQATLYRVRLQRRRSVFSWDAYIRLKAARDEYAALFKRARGESAGTAWHTPLSPDERERLRELEMELPLDSIKVARRLAYSRARLEREQCDIVAARRRVSASGPQPQEPPPLSSPFSFPFFPSFSSSSSSSSSAGGWLAWAAAGGRRQAAAVGGAAVGAVGGAAVGAVGGAAVGAVGGAAAGASGDSDAALRAEIDAALRLITAEQWTEAQRIAIAREFGLAADDVADLADAAPQKHTESKWRVVFRVGNVGLDLREAQEKGGGAFATLAMNGVALEASCAASRRVEAALRVSAFDVQSHVMGQRGVVEILRAAPERVQKKEIGDEEHAVVLSLCHRPARAMDAEGCESNADYMGIETVPNELRLRFNPMDCNVNVPFIRACLAFFAPRSSSNATPPLFDQRAGQQVDGKPSPPIHCRDVRGDARGLGTALAIVVEREFFSDWQVTITDLRIDVSEDDAHASRLTVPHLEVRNDPAQKLKKRRRIFQQQQREKEEMGVAAAVFGDQHDDWVNCVYCSIGVGAAVDSRHGGDGAQWLRLVSLPHVSLHFRKAILARRRPLDIPLLGITLDAQEPVCFDVTRCGLSVLCTSFSLVADLCQSVAQHASAGETVASEQKGHHNENMSMRKNSLFLAQLITVDEQFAVEHEEGTTTKQAEFYAGLTQLPLNTEFIHRVEVTKGLLIIYHASRPMYASHHIELCSNHVHTSLARGDPREVEILIESGGAPHDVRRGIRKARRLLIDAVGIEQLNNMPLLEEIVEQLCAKRSEAEGLALRGAFATVRAASHTRPCSRVVLRCRTEEEARQLALDIEAHAVESHALAVIPGDDKNVEREEKGTTDDDGDHHHPHDNHEDGTNRKKTKRDMEEPCVVRIDASLSHFTMRLIDEVHNGKPPVYELVFNNAFFSCVQQTRETVFRLVSTRLSLTALSICDLGQRTLLLDTVPNADSSDLTALSVAFRLRPHSSSYTSCKLTDIAVTHTTLHLSVNSELIAATEMVWDIVGIFTNQIFASVQIPCVAWVSPYDPHEAEQQWRANPACGALLRHNVHFAADSIALALHYPSDDFERAGDAIDGPVVVIEGKAAGVHWRNTESQSACRLVLQQPRVLMAGVEFVSPAWGEVRGESFQPKEETEEASCCPYMALRYTMDRAPSTLSLSDFVANAGLCGFRYTHFLALSGGHLALVYWQAQLWSLIEILTRGVLSRAAALVWRRPYIAGGPLLRWPQPDAPPAPFSWCLMHRHVQFTHITLRLPHVPLTSAADGDGVQLWARAEHVSFYDKLSWEGDRSNEGTVRAVRLTSQLALTGMDLWGTKRQQLHSAALPSQQGVMLLDKTSIHLDFVWELFRSDMWEGTTRPRRFSITFPTDAVFHGTTHHFALLLDWMYGNFIREPWKGYFSPSKMSMNPFHFAAVQRGVGESTTWNIDVPYLCLRLQDPVQLRCCIDPNGSDISSTIWLETNAMDVAVVVERLFMQLQWHPDGSFITAYDVGEASAWHLSGRAGRCPLFRRHPSEVDQNAFRFMRLHGTNQEGDNESDSDTLALHASYAVSMKNGEKAVSSKLILAAVDLSLMPLCLYNLRDTLFSLRVTNAFGRIVRWEPRLPGIISPAPSPENQDFTTDHYFTMHMLNLSIPHLSPHRRHRHWCHVYPLLVASVKETVMHSTSAKFGADRTWSIAVDSIVRNGVVINRDSSDGGWELRPVVVPQFWKQRGDPPLGSSDTDNSTSSSSSSSGGGGGAKKLLDMQQTASSGLTGSLASLWVLLPPTRDLNAIRAALVQGGYRQLQWLPAFMEERAASRAGVLSLPRSPSLLDQRVHFTIHTPCIVMAEHATLSADSPDIGNGVVFNLGSTTIARDTSGGELRVTLTGACVKSLQKGAPYVASPMGACFTGRLQSDGTWDVHIRVDAIAINVGMSLYELMLRSIAWRLEEYAEEAASADSESFDQRCTGNNSSEGTAVWRFSSSPVRPSFALWGSPDAVEGKRKCKKRQETRLKLRAEWESFSLRVSRDNTGVVVSIGEMSAIYNSSPCTESNTKDVVNSGEEGPSGSTLKYVLATAAFFTVGVYNRQPFLNLRPVTPVGGDKENDAGTSGDRHISFSLHVTEREENINVRLGRAVVFLETETVLIALTTLFEPYRRIVLPEYHLHEVKRIDRDVTLSERLVLSNRKKVHVCATGPYNYITIDGSGNEIHFIDAGSPLLLLDEGITVRIINARIHLHGKALEYYMVAGNGSYVMLEPALNLVFPGGPAALDNVNINEAEGEAEEAIMSHMELWGTLGVSKYMEPGMHPSLYTTQKLKLEPSGPQEINAPTALAIADICEGEDSFVLRRINGEVVLLITIPGEAVATGTTKPTTTATETQNQPTRSLVLQANLSSLVESTRANDVVKETGTFALSEFGVRCEYLDPNGTVVGKSSIVSEWALTVRTYTEAEQRRVEVICPRGVEIRLRYGDISFCWRTVQRAQQALGHIETNVLLDDVEGIAGDYAALPRVAGQEQQPKHQPENGQKQELQQQRTRSGGGTTSFFFSLRYLVLDLVDDSLNVEIPLFRCRVEDVETPTAIKTGMALKLHVSCTWSVTYYDFISSSWCPLLEPVFIDVVLRREPNISLEDVMQRKGSLRAGLHTRSIRLHFSTMLGDTVRRVLLLKKRLEDNLALEPLVGTTAAKLEFFTYKITQHVGEDMHINFAQQDKCGDLLPPMKLAEHETLQFNFPRTDGKELPSSHHELLVSMRHDAELVKVANVGRHLVRLGPGLMSSHVLVDISISGGQKLVTFRTNVAFYNELPFPVDVHGVRIVHPGDNFTVPIGKLRHRAIFTTLTDETCQSCAIGLNYDMLPHLYGQTLLGVCKINETEKADQTRWNPQPRPHTQEEVQHRNSVVDSSTQRAVFFLLRFAPRSCVDMSTLLDCKVTFEAPLFIVNGTSLPIHVGLMHHRVTTTKRTFLHFRDSGHYEQITTHRIESGERCSIVKVNPLLDIFVDVSFVQVNNESIGRSGFKNPKMPVLVHSANKRERARTITLKDAHGATLILHFDYSKSREVTIWCPYCFVNQTSHYIQLADVRKGPLMAGLWGDEGIPPASTNGTPFLVNSQRIAKLGDKATIFLRVGLHSSNGVLQWTRWSEQVLIGTLNECGVVNCNFTKSASVSLSYTVEFVGGRMKDTRRIILRSRWILVNRTDRSLAFRQCHVGDNDGTNHNASSRPTVLASDDCHILDLCSKDASVENAIQVKMLEQETSIYHCEWSLPLFIDKLGDRAFNVRYEAVVPGGNTTSWQEKSHPDKKVLSVDGKEFVSCAASDVMMVSCYRRSSIMYIVLSRPERPPYVVENRTRHTVCVRQRDIPRPTVVYPRTTLGFALEDTQSPPVLELWAADAPPRTRAPVVINFDPQAVLKSGNQLRQELRLPGGDVLYVRVRGLGSTSYAISVTTDTTIDQSCSLPYFQCLFQVEIDSIYALLSDTSGDFVLLTVKPLSFSFSQCAETDGGGDDEQKFEGSLCIAQVDNERPNAKERVVAQLLDSRPVVVRVVRKLLRTTPVMYFKDVMVNLASLEVHLEDSFLFHSMRFWEQLRAALGYGSGSQGNGGVDSNSAQQLTTQNPWVDELVSWQHSKQRIKASGAWKLRVVFVGHLLIEQIMVSMSLYRSPLAQNDPMWERIGYLSLFVRSVKDARFVWRRVEQRNVYETLWLLGTLYTSYYRQQLLQQMSNVLHVAGFDMMRGFVTDLLQGYFSSSIVTIIDHTKLRVGRRKEAHFVEDEQKHAAEIQEIIPDNIYGANHWSLDDDAPLMLPDFLSSSNNSNGKHFSRNGGSSGMLYAKNNNNNGRGGSANWRLSSRSQVGIVDLAKRVQWSVFCNRASDSEMRECGIFAVEHFVRTLDFANPIKMQAQLNEAALLGTKHCERCAEMEEIRILRFNSDSLSALPHPSSGILTWTEFLHHISWSEFVQMCSSSEVRQHAGQLLRYLAGEPSNMIRIEGGTQWVLDTERY